MVGHELGKLMDTLLQTAHLLAPKLERDLETMSQEVNLLILANRAATCRRMVKVAVLAVLAGP